MKFVADTVFGVLCTSATGEHTCNCNLVVSPGDMVVQLLPGHVTVPL